MASPKDKELGVRSPFRWRVGLDFENFEGVNKERDPGAIRDTQSQSIINMRLSGGEAKLRGGQEAVLETGVNGCLYGMIDVDGGLGIFVVNDMDSTVFGELPTLNVLNSLSRSYSLLQGEIRIGRIIPFAGRLLAFGVNRIGDFPGLYEISLPTNGVGLGQASLLFELEDTHDFVVNREVTSSGTNEAMYISTDGSGKIYRWDGVTLTEEATGVGSESGVLFTYAGEIYQASTNSVVARNGGAWDTSLVMPVGLVTWRPVDAIEHRDFAYICGNDDGDSGHPKVLELDGDTLTISFDPGGTTFGATALESDGANVYFTFRLTTIQDTIYTYDGLAWEEFVTHGVEEQSIPGALLVVGADLFWATTTDDLSVEGTSHGYILRYSSGDSSTETVMYESVEEDTGSATDMNVL